MIQQYLKSNLEHENSQNLLLSCMAKGMVRIRKMPYRFQHLFLMRSLRHHTYALQISTFVSNALFKTPH